LAGIWAEFRGDRGTKSKPILGPHLVYGFSHHRAESVHRSSKAQPPSACLFIRLFFGGGALAVTSKAHTIRLCCV
jgi:hypothetical protein